MKLFQVEDPTAMHSTDWFYTVAEARKNAFAQGYGIFSKVIEATILGHDDMATTIKNLLNHERRIVGRLRVIRSLGSDRQVSKEKVIPFVKLVRSDHASGKTKQCSRHKVLPFVKPMNNGEAEQCLKHKVLPIEKPLPRVTRDTVPSGAIGLILNSNGKSYQIRATDSKLDRDSIHCKTDMIGKSWFLYHDTPTQASRVPYGSYRTCTIASGIYPIVARRSAHGTNGYAFSNSSISKRKLYEIVRVVSSKTLDLRSLKLEALPNSEDMGLVSTNSMGTTKTSKKQNWTVLPNRKKPWVRIRLHKNGVWKDRNGYQFDLAEAEYKHHGYSF
jgi:hypothetical protein